MPFASTLMICPKCGFSQPDDYYCANCGVNVDKYVQKKKKGRFKTGATVALLAIAALAIAKFTIFDKDNVVTKHPPTERPQEQKSVSKTSKANELPSRLQNEPRRETPRVERFAKKRSRKNEITPTSSGEEPTKKPAPQSDLKESNLTARELFDKGVSLDDDSDREIAFYQKAIEVDPNFAPAYYRLGAIYFRQADYDLAAEHFVKFLQYGSEADKQAYNVELYFSPEDLEIVREAIEQTAPKEESPETSPESEEVESGEAGGEEVGTETSEEVQSIIKFSSTNGHMIVPVVLNGSNNSSLLFDTGAGITVLSRDLARSLGLVAEPGKALKLRTVAADVQAQVATLDSITVGDFTRTDFSVAVVDLGLGNKKGFEGILGMDFLGNYTIRIDNQANRIFLSPRR